MEGIAGVAASEEVDPDSKTYPLFREYMTAEVAAACEGALEAGAQEVVVKDAHWSARNIIPDRLPRRVRLIRGWAGHPLHMMEGLDRSFAASLVIGYHSAAGSLGNPLSHTLRSRIVSSMTINDRRTSELMISTYASWFTGVPMVFAAGDETLASEAKELVSGIETVGTMRGFGMATDNLSPMESRDAIRAGVKRALAGDRARFAVNLPNAFKIEVSYVKPQIAYGKSFYPGAVLVGERSVRFESKDYFEVLRFLAFVI